MNVSITNLMQQLRIKMNDIQPALDYAHASILRPLNNIMMNPAVIPQKTPYLNKNVKVDKNSDTLYFTGCAPYFDIMFREDFDYRGINVMNDTITLLNRTGIVPAVMNGEKCCGHDQFWRGEMKEFKALAEQNIELLGRFDNIVVNCPECLRTLTVEYQEQFGTDFKVKHVSQVLLENSKSLEKRLATTDNKKSVTFHDSCRLGRFMGIYEEPRKLLENFNFTLLEMPRNREDSICCGVSGFNNCNQTGKEIRRQKIVEATNTGADMLVVPCPKCHLHLKCLQKDFSEGNKHKIEIVDFSTLLKRSL
jgi:Fe-S oxidoreductase